MKMFLTFFSFLVIFCSLSHSQTMWEELASHPIGSGITGMVVAPNGILFATTGSFDFFNADTGGVHRSTDGGTTWERIFPAWIARTIEIDSNGVLFASIWDWPTTNEGIYKSTDLGNTWVPVHILGSNDNVFSIKAYKNGIMYAGSRRGVLMSLNNGDTWSTNTSFPIGETWVLDFEVDQNGFLYAASYAGFYYSTSGGTNWILAPGIAAGDTVVALGVLEPSKADNLRLDDNNNVLAGTTNGKIYGNSQTVVAFVALTLITIIIFSNFLVHPRFAFGGSRRSGADDDSFNSNFEEGGVVLSTDQGVTWNFDNNGLPTNATVSYITLDKSTLENTTTIYAGLFENSVGGARIFKREYKSTSVQSSNSEIPTEYFVEQNYPNPFNPSTTINFSIPEESFVSLKIFNSLGEEVETLVAQELNTGNYKYDWNAKSLTSGIYFYKLQAGIFVETKKMILMK